MAKQYCAIVDGYSAGNLLAPEFASRGYSVLHIQSTPVIWPLLLPTFRPDDFEKNFAFAGDLPALIAELKGYSPVCILPGTETGVELADALSEALRLPSNGTRRSEARRNKFLMVEAVREAGLRAALQIKSSKLNEVIAWAKEKGLKKIVVKPLNSAGTDSVAICSTEEEIRTACENILGKLNKLGLQNEEVLAQEFLQGTEYFINTVSRRGRHHYTEIWRYQKRSINGHDFVYDRNELLAFEGPEQEQLRQYVERVLDALEIKEGPAHTEVMLTAEGPVLVESGARLDGLSVPGLNQECVGYGPLDLTADTYVSPESFETKTATPYTLLKHSQTVYLTSYDEGTVHSIPGESRIRALDSFYQMRLRVKPQSPIKRTTDYFTAPGFVTLIHPDQAVVQADYEKIRAIEKEGLFQLN